MTFSAGVRSKVTIAYTLVFGVILAGFAFLVYGSSRDSALTKLDASLLTYAGRIEAEVEEQSAEGIFPAPDEFRSLSPGDLTRQRFLLRALDGRTVIDDSLLSAVVPEGERARRGHESRVETIQLGGEEFRVYTGPVEVADTAAFFVATAAPLSGITPALERLRLLLLLTVPGVLVIAAIAAWFIARAAFLPVSSMIATAGRISAINLGARLDLPGADDEIRRLGMTLNGMMERIEKAFRSQQQFIADASHEMRTPLTVIRSDLELLVKQSRSVAHRREISRVVAEIDRLSKLAENLLLLSRLDAAPAGVERRPVRIDEVVVESVRDMTPLFRGRGVALSLHVAEAMEISGVRDELSRAVFNLLENSLKFTKRGGRVNVSLGRERGSETPVTLTVQDTGCGIAPRDLPHIFGRFYRAGEVRGDGGGSGLGLALVDQIVKHHGGMIAVESEPGKGTTFALRFPGL